MILQGVLDRSLGNFTCLRGYATLAELYEISEPDPSYQRNLILHQQERMEKFLDDSQYLYFPEVILGASLDHGDSENEVNTFFQTIYSPLEEKSYKFVFSQFKLDYTVTKRKSPDDVRVPIRFRRAQIEVNNKLLEQGEFKKFHRIDGNHRLSILNDDLEEPLTLEKVQKYGRLNVPFCLVLFEHNEDLVRNSSALFHNINYRQISLTMEQSLKQILGNKELFPDNILFQSFGIEYVLARKVLQSWDLISYIEISRVIDSTDNNLTCKRTFLLTSFNYLIQQNLISEKFEDVEMEVNRFKQKLPEIELIYKHKLLGKNLNFGLTSAFIFYSYGPHYKLKIFKKWVIDNHIYQTEKIQLSEIVKIFNCVLESKEKTVFVSMKNGGKSEKNYLAIEKAIKEINRDHKLDISIKPLRVDQVNLGSSFDINKKILDLIEGAGLLIADLTFSNENVYHEIGYLMGLNRGKELENFILLYNDDIAPFGEEIGFNLRGYQQIRVNGELEVCDKIKQSVSVFYNLIDGEDASES